jgi:hypothetical protein
VDSQSLITWGLGAIVLLLMVSTVVQIFQRVFPTVRDMFNETAGDARYTYRQPGQIPIKGTDSQDGFELF